VAQNDNAAALRDARRGVELSPDSAAAKIALSYALQADFQIESARDTMQSAVAQRPDDALAWARLAEVELMLGRRSQALAAAQKAKAIAPNLARTDLVLGFNALAVFRNGEAKIAFQRAIKLDSADPLAHLGLGLAEISAGKLEAGRRDLEAAVGLDSSNALLRAYLGKAYFEERRYPLDSQQYAIAKQLDPLDPTAYLYDGILKQTINRPVDAVADLRRSVELNDNRAVYRSRLLLDEDRAARATSLAQAYKDLGFNEIAITESAKSLALDPSNASAHRFLSDTYQGLRRLEIARVSELLQAQLLQDVNVNPVQPSLSETNLNIITLGGPARPGFNEYTPLFTQNQAQFNATALGGNKDTYGGEAVLSGLYGGYSFSVGTFAYRTDGWRPNNGLDRNISNLYVQAALTPAFNIQAEYRRQESEAGDLAFNLDPEQFLLDAKDKRDSDTYRVGLRYTWQTNSKSTLLFSYIHNDQSEHHSQSEEVDPVTNFAFDSDVEDKGNQVEVQYIYQTSLINAVVGGGYSDSDRTIRDQILVTDADVGPIFQIDETTDQQIEHSRGYAYIDISSANLMVDWTIGASYDDYQEGILKETSFNPKFGVQWHPTDDVTVRAAAFKVLKPLVVNNRTIEPTQVAGFNQFFDDINGTKSWRYGIGGDWRILQGLTIGAEATGRQLDEPLFRFFDDPPTTDFEDRNEELHRLFLYWTPHSRVGMTAEAVYDRFSAEKGVLTEFNNVPEKVETISLPIGVTYFDPSGFFAGLSGTFVDQEVQRSSTAYRASGEDNFFIVDASVGYRLPKRYGIVSIGVRNLFDQEFRFQDDSYREFRGQSSTGPYFPQRLVQASITISL